MPISVLHRIKARSANKWWHHHQSWTFPGFSILCIGFSKLWDLKAKNDVDVKYLVLPLILNARFLKIICSMERVKYFVRELAHFHVPAAKDSISDLICKWCRLSNTSILLYYARNIFPFHHLLKCSSYIAFHTHFLSWKRRL